MFTMNVPKYLWGEAVKTAAYLINWMPSRVLDHKTPIECLNGTNDFIVPLRRYLVVLVLFMITGLRRGSLIHVPSNAYLWAIRLLKRDIDAGAQLKGGSL